MQFEEHGGGLLERFVDRIHEGPFWATAPGHLFAHAAFHPRMLSGPVDDEVREVAFHGYGTSKERRAGHLARRWVDSVPRGLTVVVGHAVTESGVPETVEGRLGGRAVFADTGFWLGAGAAPVIEIPL